MPYLGAGLLGATSVAVCSFNVPMITSKVHMVGRRINSGLIFEPYDKTALSQAADIVKETNVAEETLAPSTEQLEEAPALAASALAHEKRGYKAILSGDREASYLQIG